MSRIAAIVPAAGLGTRMGAETPKQFLELDGMPLILFTLRRLAACSAITEFFISTRAEDIVSLQDKVAKAGLGRPARVVHGGDTRQQSVANALAQTPQAFQYALIRDAFRAGQKDGVTASDESGLVERFGHDVYVVQGSDRNLKITRPADMELARFYLAQERAGK